MLEAYLTVAVRNGGINSGQAALFAEHITTT